MLRFLVLASVVASSVVLCVSGASVEGPGSSRFLSIGAGHDHEYNCTGGGIFTDQADDCAGFHVCGFNFATNSYEHKFYVSCPLGTLYNDQLHICQFGYTCPA